MAEGGGDGAIEQRRGVVAHANHRPDAVAMVMGSETRTYGELVDRARRLAHVLMARGAGPGQTVAAVLPNGFESFEVATAAAMAGAPFLPVNWHLKAGELEYLLSDAGVSVVVGHQSLAGALLEATAAIDQISTPLLVGPDPKSAPSAVPDEQSDYEGAIGQATPDPTLDSGPGPELVFYTSGTTARPKGVVHGGLGRIEARTAGMEGQAMLWGWSSDDVYVMSGPSYHAAHAGWGLASLYVGATMVLLPKFGATDFLAAVADHLGTRSFMVPSHFIRILELPEKVRQSFDTSTFNLIVHGGAPCPVAVKRRMMEEFPQTKIYELYGASEGGATRISPEEWLDRPGSVGLPWPGVEIRVVGEAGETVEPGVDGVVWIKPPKTQKFTYRNDPEGTAKAWHDDAFSVGDIGHLDEAGYLTITDRVSDMVLWGGVNIAPREIEEALYEHPAVVDCAVFGIPDARDGEHLKALVELRTRVSTDELAEHVRQRLADYKVPHVWEIVAEVPRDPNGKVVKRLLRQ